MNKKIGLAVKIPLITVAILVLTLLYMIFAAGPNTQTIEKIDSIQPEIY